MTVALLNYCSVEQAQKGGYPCFMQKEIHEQPRALADTIDERIQND